MVRIELGFWMHVDSLIASRFERELFVLLLRLNVLNPCLG